MRQSLAANLRKVGKERRARKRRKKRKRNTTLVRWKNLLRKSHEHLSRLFDFLV